MSNASRARETGNSRTRRMTFTCPQCGVTSNLRPSTVARIRYCSMRCRSLAAKRGIRPKAHFSEEELVRRSRDKIGEKNPMWKGDLARPESKRARAQRAYSLGPCQECGKPAIDRHHRDGDIGNNDLSNIAILCRRCHMIEDGRLERLKHRMRTNHPMASARKTLGREAQ